MRISSVGTAFPAHRYSQAEITEKLRNRWESKLPEPRLLGRLFANCGVEFRNFVLQKAIGAVFTEAVRVMVNAFLKRARTIYGPPAVASAMTSESKAGA